MSAFKCRIESILRGVGVALVAALLAAEPARACDPPRVVGLETTIPVGEGETVGSLGLNAFFVQPHATFDVTATSLPIPEIGYYRLLLSSPAQTIEVGSFDVDETGSSVNEWSLMLDLRSFVLEAETVELWDGINLVASQAVRSRGQISLFAEARRNQQLSSPRLTFNGFIERRSADYLLYDFRIDGVKIPRGDYVLELAGLTDSYEIPFTVDATRRVTVRVRGNDQDLLTRTLDWTLAIVHRGDEVVATLPLGCRN